jgi:hypothetical protein
MRPQKKKTTKIWLGWTEKSKEDTFERLNWLLGFERTWPEHAGSPRSLRRPETERATPHACRAHHRFGRHIGPADPAVPTASTFSALVVLSSSAHGSSAEIPHKTLTVGTGSQTGEARDPRDQFSVKEPKKVLKNVHLQRAWHMDGHEQVLGCLDHREKKIRRSCFAQCTCGVYAARVAFLPFQRSSGPGPLVQQTGQRRAYLASSLSHLAIRSHLPDERRRAAPRWLQLRAPNSPYPSHQLAAPRTESAPNDIAPRRRAARGVACLLAGLRVCCTGTPERMCAADDGLEKRESAPLITHLIDLAAASWAVFTSRASALPCFFVCFAWLLLLTRD